MIFPGTLAKERGSRKQLVSLIIGGCQGFYDHLVHGTDSNGNPDTVRLLQSSSSLEGDYCSTPVTVTSAQKARLMENGH